MFLKKLIFSIVASFLSFWVIAQQEPVRISGYAQGTTYHISYFDKKNRDFQPAIEKILKQFDKSVSTYDSKSIISRINRNIPHTRTDKYFETCFRKGEELYRLTDGNFDPTVYSLVNLWGFGAEKQRKASQQVIDSLLQFVGMEKVTLKNHKIIKQRPQVKLDFNAYAQGYTVDVVAQFLQKKKITSFLVEIGGEVYAFGKKPDGNLWTVGIERPDNNKTNTNVLKATAQLYNKAIATSGNYHKFREENGVKYSHHINPKTGYPVQNTMLSASVICDDTLSADAIATALMVMGLEKSKDFLSKNQQYQAFIIYSDNEGHFQEYITDNIKNIIKDLE